MARESTRPCSPDVVWLRQPGADRLTLHASAFEMARGDIITITEDHVRPDPDWCDAILRAHREQPEAVAIVGAVKNGSTKRLSDRASFPAHVGVIPPATFPSAAAGAAVQQRVGEAADHAGDASARRVRVRIRAGSVGAGKISVDDRMMVEHVQDVSMTEALVMHFHNGRTYGGTFIDEPRSLRLRRSLDALRTPERVTAEMHREIAQRSSGSHDSANVVGVAVIAGAHALGCLVGLVTGRGRSPRRLT
jgi:hypothetical protein